jgi:aspartate/tyrosine/aromatic aminotransferase
MAMDFIRKFHSADACIYFSNPTWGNHGAIVKEAGLTSKTHRYLDASGVALDFDGILTDMREAPMGSVWLLQACAHNPTGVDPSTAQWEEIAKLCAERSFVPLFDNAYQGFATGDFDGDVSPIRLFVSKGLHPIVTQSFAKNMGLYGERVGAIHVVTGSSENASAVLSNLAIISRRSFSNPPCHGAYIVATVVGDAAMKNEWFDEVKGMNGRIRDMRLKLRAALEAEVPSKDWSHITKQIGMFSFTGLSKAQCTAMTENHHIYLLDNGRISVAGLNAEGCIYFAKAVKEVLQDSSL